MKRIFTLLITIMLWTSAFGQDIHFSQMRYTPLTVNPALAGADGKIRGLVNYRSQWNSFSAPYSTMAASFDMRFEPFKRDGGYLAGGINFFRDVAGDAKMTQSNVNANIAYHLPVTRESTIGLGMQLGFGQRGIGNMDGTWSTQYTSSGFDNSIASGESFERQQYSHLDASAGVVYKLDKMTRSSAMRGSGYKITAGLAAYHLNQPENSFLVGGEDDLKMRIAGFVRSTFFMNNPKWKMKPGIYYQQQGGHREILGGSYFEHSFSGSSDRTQLKNNFAVAYGFFYRFRDALVSKLLVHYDDFSLGLSYDINLSSLTPTSRGRGGIEFMFRYQISELGNKKIR